MGLFSKWMHEHPTRAARWSSTPPRHPRCHWPEAWSAAPQAACVPCLHTLLLRHRLAAPDPVEWSRPWHSRIQTLYAHLEYLTCTLNIPPGFGFKRLPLDPSNYLILTAQCGGGALGRPETCLQIFLQRNGGGGGGPGLQLCCFLPAGHLVATEQIPAPGNRRQPIFLMV